MKKIVLLIAISLFAFTSCYDDYILDNDRQAVGFANQTDVRSVVIGEGMKFSTGIVLTGVIDNKSNREINYKIDNGLVNEATLNALKGHSLGYIKSLCANITELKELPSNEYRLINDGGKDWKTLIGKGQHFGKITVEVDSLAFLGGSANLIPEFVLPISITDAAGLDILDGRASTVIGVRYENMLFGTYIHSYEATVVDAEGNEEKKTLGYTNNQSNDLVWTLTTVGPYSLTANAVGAELNGSAAQMKLTVSNDGKIQIEPVEGAKYRVEPDGESYFNRARLLQDRKIYLSYKFVDGEGRTWYMKDVLHFRNRIRDGVNEWQDENPEHYK